MKIEEGKFGYGRARGVEILEMPYAGGALSMIVVLPRKRTVLSVVERRLSRGHIARWLATLSRRTTQVFLPLFRLRPERALPFTEVLRHLGLWTALTPDADFSGMAGGGGGRGRWSSAPTTPSSSSSGIRRPTSFSSSDAWWTRGRRDRGAAPVAGRIQFICWSTTE